MTIEALGKFAEGFTSWRKLVASMPDDEGRWRIFSNAAHEVAQYVPKGLDKIVAVDELNDIASAYGLADADAVQGIISHAFRDVIPADREQRSNGHDKAPGLVPTYRPFPLIEKDIPPRDWVIPGLLMRKQVTVLVAPSGAGKSLLTLQVGIACALRQQWAGWRPRRKFRVLFINSEDDIDEMRRRLAAAVHRMEIDQAALADEFQLVDTGNGAIVAKFDAKTKTLVRTPLLEQVVATILANKIDVVFVDPFAETFEGDENSNSELKWAGILWREVARRTNAAVCLVHHTKKYATGMAGDVDAARGAGALIGIARIVSTIFPMTQKEAEAMLEKAEQDNRAQYLRYDDAKANLNLTSSVAKWFRKETITLDNANGEQPADQVGTLVPWKPKGLMDGILEEQINKFFARVDEGILDSNGNPTGEFFTFDTRKGSEHEISRYVGDLIAKFFKITHDRAVSILNAWRENGRLFEADKYRSPRTRKERSRCLSELSKSAQPQPMQSEDQLPFV
jgi:hypothetical protein